LERALSYPTPDEFSYVLTDIGRQVYLETIERDTYIGDFFKRATRYSGHSDITKSLVVEKEFIDLPIEFMRDDYGPLATKIPIYKTLIIIIGTAHV